MPLHLEVVAVLTHPEVAAHWQTVPEAVLQPNHQEAAGPQFFQEAVALHPKKAAGAALHSEVVAVLLPVLLPVEVAALGPAWAQAEYQTPRPCSKSGCRPTAPADPDHPG